MSELSIVDAPALVCITECFVLRHCLSADSDFHERPLENPDLEAMLDSSFHALHHTLSKKERIFTYIVTYDSFESGAFTHTNNHGVLRGLNHHVWDPLLVPVEDN